MVMEKWCLICKNSDENVDHLLLHYCPVAMGLWKFVFVSTRVKGWCLRWWKECFNASIEVLRLLEIEHVSYSLFNACMEGEEYEDVWRTFIISREIQISVPRFTMLLAILKCE